MLTSDQQLESKQSIAGTASTLTLPSGRLHFAKRFRALAKDLSEIPKAAREGWFVDNLTTADLLIIGALEQGYFCLIPQLKERFDAGQGEKREIGDALRIAQDILSDKYPCLYPYTDTVLRFQNEAASDEELTEYRELTLKRHFQAFSLTGELLADVLEQEHAAGTETLHPSDDFRSVKWGDKLYVFTANQAACFKVLYEAWRNGTPVLGQQFVCETAGVTTERLREVFRYTAVFDDGVIVEARKGNYRLSDPPTTNLMPTA